MSVLDSCKTGWSWLKDETNRKIIAWIGSGLVVASSGMWVAYEKMDRLGPGSSSKSANAPVAASKPPQPKPSDQTPSGGKIEIGGDGIVGGRDVTTGPVQFGD